MKWPWPKKKFNADYESYFNMTIKLGESIKNIHPELSDIEIEEKIISSLKVSIIEEGALSENEKTLFLKKCNKIGNLSFYDKTRDLLFFMQQRYHNMKNPMEKSIIENFIHWFIKRAVE